MKKVFNRTVALLLCATLVAGVSTQLGWKSASATEKKMGAYKSALDSIREDIKSSQMHITDEDIATGSKARRRSQLKEAEALPSKMDLRDVDGKNYVTPVKLQTRFLKTRKQTRSSLLPRPVFSMRTVLPMRSSKKKTAERN